MVALSLNHGSNELWSGFNLGRPMKNMVRWAYTRSGLTHVTWVARSGRARQLLSVGFAQEKRVKRKGQGERTGWENLA
jgi:hypothetical protein